MPRIYLEFMLLFCCLLPADLQAKKRSMDRQQVDTTYISDHSRDLTLRVYGSRKLTRYELRDNRFGSRITYRPNDPFNIGIGANYKFIGINLGFKAPFINRGESLYGHTSFLDLQSHIYLRKVVADLYYQQYQGYHLDNPDILLRDSSDTGFPYRGDLHTTTAGATVQYLFNSRKFSLRAPYIQTEYQKKSAGSFMLGGGLYVQYVKADAGIIPLNMRDTGFFDGHNFNRTQIYSLTLNGGYGYTLVLRKHFFATLAVNGGIGINETRLSDRAAGYHESKAGLEFSTDVRVAAGYNSEKYFAGIHFLNHTGRSAAPYPQTSQEMDAGLFRISMAMRFKIKRLAGRF